MSNRNTLARRNLAKAQHLAYHQSEAARQRERARRETEQKELASKLPELSVMDLIKEIASEDSNVGDVREVRPGDSDN